MAGFDINDPYYVLWMHLELPKPLEVLQDILFPSLQRWKAEQSGIVGDPTCAAQNFLYQVVPYMTKVIVQDGIYFIKDFPDHPVSNLLKNKIDSYETWAASACAEVQARENSVEMENIRDLNEAAQSAFHQVETQVNKVHKDLHWQFFAEMQQFDLANEARCQHVNNDIVEIQGKID